MSNETTFDYLTVLDSIRDSLATTLLEVEKQEQALADEQIQEQGTGERTVIWHHSLDRMGDRFREWSDGVTAALRRASQIEQQLTESEAELNQSLARLKDVAQRLGRGLDHSADQQGL